MVEATARRRALRLRVVRLLQRFRRRGDERRRLGEDVTVLVLVIDSHHFLGVALKVPGGLEWRLGDAGQVHDEAGGVDDDVEEEDDAELAAKSGGQPRRRPVDAVGDVAQATTDTYREKD